MSGLCAFDFLLLLQLVSDVQRNEEKECFSCHGWCQKHITSSLFIITTWAAGYLIQHHLRGMSVTFYTGDFFEEE